MLEKINEIEVTPEEIEDLLEEGNRWSEEGYDGGSASLFLVAQKYPGETFRAFAVHTRIAALMTLAQEAESRGWVLPDSPQGSVIMRDELIKAAAHQPLIEQDNDFTFDRESFYSKALEIAESEGQA